MFAPAKVTPYTDHQAVRTVVRFMREHAAEPLSLKEMAEVAFLSPYHFNRVFRRVTGIPPGRFLTALRLEKAKHFLLTSNLRITDICFEVGYNSLGTFSSRFSQLVGLSPYDFRSLARGDHSLDRNVFTSETAKGQTAALSGTVVAGQAGDPGAAAMPVFIGLFKTPVPQNQPVVCTVLPEPGAFRLDSVPDGRYYVFAASFPWSDDPSAYLLPGERQELFQVGAGDRPVVVRHGRFHGQTELTLRRMQITDPPLLSALLPRPLN